MLKPFANEEATPKDAFTNTELPSSEIKASKSTSLFVRNHLASLRTLTEDIDVEKLNKLLHQHKEGESVLDEVNKINRLKSDLIRFLDELKIRIDLDSEVLDSQRESMNDLATKTDLEKIRSVQNEGFCILKMKEEVISETQSFLVGKLGEINSLIQRQIQEQEKQERTRTNSEVSFKQKLDLITSLLQSDLGNMKSAIKEIEAGEMGSKKRDTEKI